MMKMTSFSLLLLESLVDLHKSVQLQVFFGVSGWNIDLDYGAVEWFVLKMKLNHSVIFEVVSKYCILDSCCL